MYNDLVSTAYTTFAPARIRKNSQEQETIQASHIFMTTSNQTESDQNLRWFSRVSDRHQA